MGRAPPRARVAVLWLPLDLAVTAMAIVGLAMVTVLVVRRGIAPLRVQFDQHQLPAAPTTLLSSRDRAYLNGGGPMTENYALIGWVMAMAVAGTVVWVVAVELLNRERPRARGRRPRQIDLSMWTSTWQSGDTDVWMAPLRTGGARTERRIRRTLAERGLLLARRVGRRARRLRQAMAKGGGS